MRFRRRYKNKNFTEEEIASIGTQAILLLTGDLQGSGSRLRDWFPDLAPRS